MRGRELDVAIRAEHEQPHVGDLPRDEAEEPERRQLGHLEIVEHHHQRATLGRGPEEGAGRVEELEAGRIGLDGLGGQLGEEIPNLGQDVRDVGRPGRELAAGDVCIGLAQV